jgi:hypothetical protein
MCHIIKSYDEGDYVNKKYKKDLESWDPVRIFTHKIKR